MIDHAAMAPANARAYTDSRMSTATIARTPRSSKAADFPLARATIHVAEPPHLCRVQTITRELCRSVGLDESSVFQAVISVTELAHGVFIQREQCGVIQLSAVRRKNGLALEVRAENAAVPSFPPIRISLTIPFAAAPPHGRDAPSNPSETP